ncbi:hypothetical protein BT69DRAFT_613104 [Atractiella rhizophila]|nr:hypothetical protein BT69DRAFT_613104 [Atractiella rhizophila]
MNPTLNGGMGVAMDRSNPSSSLGGGGWDMVDRSEIDGVAGIMGPNGSSEGRERNGYGMNNGHTSLQAGPLSQLKRNSFAESARFSLLADPATAAAASFASSSNPLMFDAPSTPPPPPASTIASIPAPPPPPPMSYSSPPQSTYKRRSLPASEKKNGKGKSVFGSFFGGLGDALSEGGGKKRFEISTPYDPVHLTHVGFNSDTGEFTGLPKEWQQLLSASGSRSKNKKLIPRRSPILCDSIRRRRKEWIRKKYGKSSRRPPPRRTCALPSPTPLKILDLLRPDLRFLLRSRRSIKRERRGCRRRRSWRIG